VDLKASPRSLHPSRQDPGDDERAELNLANLKGAHVEGADFHGATLWSTHLDGDDLRDATGLTTEQLASAYGDAKGPPRNNRVMVVVG
jgi:uncharacterized protein YjbI with pentapeptide repeats